MSKSFSKAINDLKGVPEQKARAAALNLFNVIVEQSHVKTGRYRANWQISAGSPKLNQINSTQKPSGDASSVMNDKSGVIYITNNVPYATRLEYGWSSYMPQGNVRLALSSAWPQILRNMGAK